ncbi:hypothetical protein EZ428_09115 [Pedobacter frigiditerrae]|uniref:Uncharacterized protein n=1 Tax=Pedobacter frigiditerrae TaxID=2530452 RepID=A0A4R0MXA3_9SPHI|nr:hypothetical protein [Pedobacter frigiditerrae]TCC91898.1 hypothetical protein EZ428_09115 [Pedobacter frigiditerrae]
MSSIIPKPVIYLTIGCIVLFSIAIGVFVYSVKGKRANSGIFNSTLYGKSDEVEPFNKDADKKEYERVMTEYLSLTTMANGIYPVDTTLVGREKAMSDVKDIGIYYWTRNLEILDELKQIDLPKQLVARVQLFKEYCQLNKECCELIYKAVDEHSTAYDEKIEAYFTRIDAKVKVINGG